MDVVYPIISTAAAVVNQAFAAKQLRDDCVELGKLVEKLKEVLVCISEFLNAAGHSSMVTTLLQDVDSTLQHAAALMEKIERHSFTTVFIKAGVLVQRLSAIKERLRGSMDRLMGISSLHMTYGVQQEQKRSLDLLWNNFQKQLRQTQFSQIKELEEQFAGLTRKVEVFQSRSANATQEALRQFGADIRAEMRDLGHMVKGTVVSGQEVEQALKQMQDEVKQCKDRKQEMEDQFMAQIVAMLSLADNGGAQHSNPLLGSMGTRSRPCSAQRSNPPAHLMCPIGLDLMDDPVMLVESGQVFDRQHITEHLSRGNRTCPISRKALETCQLVPVYALRSAVEEWRLTQHEEGVKAHHKDPFHSLSMNSSRGSRGSASLPAASSSTAVNIVGRPTSLSPSVTTPPGPTTSTIFDPFGNNSSSFGALPIPFPTPSSTIPTPYSMQPDAFGDEPAFGLRPTPSPTGQAPTTVRTLAMPHNAQTTAYAVADDRFSDLNPFAPSSIPPPSGTSSLSRPSTPRPSTPHPGSTPATAAALSANPFDDNFVATTPSATPSVPQVPALRRPPSQPPCPAAASPAWGGLDPALGVLLQPQSTTTSTASPPLDLDDRLGMHGPSAVLAAFDAPTLAAPSTPTAAAVATSSNPELHFEAGVKNMEVAYWPEAKAAFSQALLALAKEPKGGNHGQCVAVCAQYYAAVRLLEVATLGTGPREARLYRFAAALKLGDDHQMKLLRESARRNQALGNYRYCADQLAVIFTKCLGTAPVDYVAELHRSISECNRCGNTNASVPADEKTDIFVEIVSAATATADVDVVVDSIIFW